MIQESVLKEDEDETLEFSNFYFLSYHPKCLAYVITTANSTISLDMYEKSTVTDRNKIEILYLVISPLIKTLGKLYCFFFENLLGNLLIMVLFSKKNLKNYICKYLALLQPSPFLQILRSSSPLRPLGPIR